MANKSITLILVLYFLFASAHTGLSTTIFRGLKLITTDAEALDSTRFNAYLDTKDPKVVELGKFVIEEQNKKDANSRLNFASVLKAVSGRSGKVQRYGLIIGASDSTGSDEYYAYVLVNQDSKELVAFRKKE